MQGQLFKKKDITEALETMVDGAKIRGGEDGDNISVVAYVKKGSKLALLSDSQYILKLTKILMAIIAVLLIIALTIYYSKSDDKKSTPELNATEVQELSNDNSSKPKKVETTPHVNQLSLAHNDKDKPSVDRNDTNNTNSDNTTSLVTLDEFEKTDTDQNSSSVNTKQKTAVITTEDNKTTNENLKHEVDSDETDLIKHNHLPHTTIIQKTKIPKEAIKNNEKNASE